MAGYINGSLRSLTSALHSTELVSRGVCNYLCNSSSSFQRSFGKGLAYIEKPLICHDMRTDLFNIALYIIAYDLKILANVEWRKRLFSMTTFETAG